MSESEPITPSTTELPTQTNGFVFDDDVDFVYDGDADMVLDEDGNWVKNDIETSEITVEQKQTGESKYGDNPIIFAEYAIAGMRPQDLSEYSEEEGALYKDWLDSLDENTRLIINERKRAQSRYDVVRDEMLKSSPFLLEGKLSAKQIEKLGSEKYVLGVNQSQAFSIEDAKDYLKEDNGIGLGMYGLDQRFVLLDENSTKADAEYTERAVVGGYYQNSNIGRFIIAVPMDGRQNYGAPQDAVSEANAIEDFTQSTGEFGGRSVSPKYIAGFVDNTGKYHENRNFGESHQPLFDEADSINISDTEAHKTRESFTQNFTQFKPLIDNLKARLENHEDTRDDEAYLGGGGNSRAFALTLDGKEYVAIVPAVREAWKPNSNVDARVQPLLAVQGVPHLEQIAAVSYEDGVTISERIPGIALGYETPLAAVSDISQEQADVFVDTILAGCERGIVFDPKISNFLYDPKEGFGVIDFQSPDTRGVVARDVATQFSDVITGINQMATGKHLPTTLEDFAYQRDGAKIRLDFLRKIRTAASSKLSGDDLSAVVGDIDKRISSLKDEELKLSDGEYINTVMQKNLGEVSRQQALARNGNTAGWGAI